MLTAFQHGLVDKHGPWDGKPPNYGWKRSDGAVDTAPLGAGGTAHAGHGNWKTVVRPTRVIDGIGLSKPSGYVMHNLIDKKPSAHNVSSTSNYRPPGYRIHPRREPLNRYRSSRNFPHDDEEDDAPIEPPPDPSTPQPAQYFEATPIGRKDSATYQLNNLHIDSVKTEYHRLSKEGEHLRHLLDYTGSDKHAIYQRISKNKEQKEILEKEIMYHHEQQKHIQQDHASEQKAFNDINTATQNALQDPTPTGHELKDSLRQVQHEHAIESAEEQKKHLERLAQDLEQQYSSGLLSQRTKKHRQEEYEALAADLASLKHVKLSHGVRGADFKPAPIKIPLPKPDTNKIVSATALCTPR